LSFDFSNKLVLARLVAFAAGAFVYLSYPREIYRFRRRLGRWPHPGNPRSFSDKMLWRKVFDRNPLFTVVSDKLAIKTFGRERVPGLSVARTLWTGKRAEDIPAAMLAGTVVVKANHGSSLLVFVHHGDVDRPALNAQANRWLKVAHDRRMNEWGYAGVERKIMVEEMLLDGGKPVRKELKFHLFNGRVFLCNMILGRGVKTRSCAFARDGSRIGPIGIYGGAENEPLPPVYAKAVTIAETLCAGFDYMRCDLYVVGDEIYLGEFTVYGQGGYTNFKSESIMREMARRWDIRRSWFMNSDLSGFKALYARALDALQDRADEAS
jgi:hypothetical protein